MSAAADLDPDHLPLRMTTAEVCSLGRFSLSAFNRKRLADPAWLPPSTVQLGRSTVFDRDAVLKALGLATDGASHAPAGDPWTFDPDAFRKARSRPVRDRSAAQGRDGAGTVRGSAQAAALRVVAGDPPPRPR